MGFFMVKVQNQVSFPARNFLLCRPRDWGQRVMFLDENHVGILANIFSFAFAELNKNENPYQLCVEMLATGDVWDAVNEYLFLR